MPDSLKFVVSMLALAALSAPVSLYVQKVQLDRQARTIAGQLTGGGDPEAGKAAIRRYGCGGCHQIPGLMEARGEVGPALKSLAGRTEIAGWVQNQPDQLIAWIRRPQTIAPGVGMPDLGVGDKEGRDIAAYLYAAGRS